MISEFLSQKEYKLFRGEVFIDREKEVEFFKDFFNELPRKILFVYGPKSTGKTTLIEYVIENELIDNKKIFKSSKYNIKYVNFRAKLIGSYNTFLDSIIRKQDEEIEAELGYEINLGVFRLAPKLYAKAKEKEEDVFDLLLNQFKKSKKKNIFIIDEIQVLEDIYINGSRELLKEFLNFCVRLTKETHLTHVVILTSNTIFLNRIYNDSKLKETSEFKLINHPDENVAKKLLKDLGYNQKQIDLIIEYFGTIFSRLIKVYQYIKPTEDIEKLKEFLEKEKLDAYMQINDMFVRNKKYHLPDNVDEIFKELAKELIKKEKYILKEKDLNTQKRVYPVIEVFCEKEILFYDPQTGLITPNSRIYLKAMEDLSVKRVASSR